MIKNILPKSSFSGISFGKIIAFVSVFLFFGGSIYAGGKTLNSYLATTYDIETNETFKRLVSGNPLYQYVAKAQEGISSLSGISLSDLSNLSIEELIAKIASDVKSDLESGDSTKKESLTSDTILSLLGLSSISPISNVASAFSNLSSADNNFIVGEGLTWSVKSGSDARSSLGLGSGNTPTFGGLKIDSDQVLKKEAGDVLKLLSIDSLDNTTTGTIESSMEANIDTLEGISSIGSSGSTTRITLETALESDIDTLSNLVTIGDSLSSIGSAGNTTRATLESAMEEDLDLGGDVTSTGLTSVTVGKIRGISFGTPTPTSGNLLIADGDSWESVAMSGNATISSSGVLTISSIPKRVSFLKQYPKEESINL